MITRLSDITLKNFISLLEGHYNVLLEEGDGYKEEAMRKIASDLIYEYKSIVNPSGVEAALLDREEYLKINAQLVMANSLYGMLATGDTEGVKAILEEVGVSIHGELAEAVSRFKAEAEYLKKKYEDEHQKEQRKETDIRKRYDSEIAFLMTYYKMNIDVNVISAGVYANMLHQADSEIKRKINRG